MDRSYSILILPRQGTGTRHLVVSRKSIRIFTGTVLILLGLSGWLLGDYFWIKLEGNGLKIQGAQLKEEVSALSARLKEELATMNSKHREELLVLQDRAKASRQLLISWKDLRKKIQDSLPRKRRSSLTGQRIVGELETILSSLENELDGIIASIPPSDQPRDG